MSSIFQKKKKLQNCTARDDGKGERFGEILLFFMRCGTRRRDTEWGALVPNEGGVVSSGVEGVQEIFRGFIPAVPFVSQRALHV